MMITIDIEGDPIPWARPGIYRLKKTNIIFDRQKREKEMTAWRIRSEFKEEPFTVPLEIDFIFRMPIPKSSSAPIRREMINGNFHHNKKPDLDNLCKFILDTMNGLVFKDDSQICAMGAKKIYSSKPGTLIKITPLTKNNRGEQEEIYDGYNLRDDGPGDVLRDSSEQKRDGNARGQKGCVIPFGTG